MRFNYIYMYFSICTAYNVFVNICSEKQQRTVGRWKVYEKKMYRCKTLWRINILYTNSLDCKPFVKQHIIMIGVKLILVVDNNISKGVLM